MRAALFTSLCLVGCGGSEGDYLVVTVDKRPAVNSAAVLEVKLTNEGSERIQDFPLGDNDFPVTFSVATPGRIGDLGIEVTALDANGLLVGRGAATTTVDMQSASVLVDTADFVINTEYAEDQQLANFYPAIGYQLAAAADGTWTAVHSADCPTPCHVFGRRFDKNGQPVSSTIAAGTNSFPMSTRLTTFFSTPVVAASGSTTLAIWNYDTPPPDTVAYSIDCRAFDANGAAVTGQLTISTDEYPNMAAVTALPTGNFAVSWEGEVTNVVMIRSAIVKPDCTVLAPGVLQVSTQTAPGGPMYSSVAASGDRIMYAWLLENNVHIRMASTSNSFQTVDTRIINKTATEHIEHVRVAPLPGGNFAVFARWANITGTTGPGRIDMYRTNNAGVVQGAPVTVTMRSGTDFASSQGFGVAAHGDGSIFVVWHACATNGDDSGCGVFGRLVQPTGQLGPELQLNTTTKDDQTGPSAVALPGAPAAFVTAWTDRSQTMPDTAGASVRARVIYTDASTPE